MDLGLKSKVAMVGGASKGLGYAVAHALAAEGAQVSIASRDGDAIASAASTISRETGSKVFSVAADLSTADAIARWHAATVEQFGGVDLLFANTGGPPAGTPLSFDDNAWHAAFDLLVMSVVRTVRLVVPSMRARGGGAILIGTSSSVKEPIPNLALSNVMRSGRDLACQIAFIGARARQDSREYTDSRAHRDRPPEIPRRSQREKSGNFDRRAAEAGAVDGSTGPLRRPHEFGRAGAFLLSDAASYITGAGEGFQVDGGLIRSGLLVS